jgi:hypothetical protein
MVEWKILHGCIGTSCSEPCMSEDLGDCETFRWVIDENILDEIAGI